MQRLGDEGKKASRDLQAEHHQVYADVEKARQEWERAMKQFEYALGKDEIDYAIYVLEAAERKYQIHLKQAKRLSGVDEVVNERKLSM
ncbi:DUF2508 family protein [Paenibacillus barcinonensis]|nr:DUF2508 family protein [Paenibacillus barcinonensis]